MNSIENTLNDIRCSLLNGEYDKLGNIIFKIENEISDIKKRKMTKNDMIKIIEKARMNTVFLQLAISGMKSGKRIVDDIISSSNKMNIYDKNGKKYIYSDKKLKIKRV